MKVLVTAGNTLTPIDRVRCITNVFTGRTGTRIALEAHARNHEVTLLTSHAEVVEAMHAPGAPALDQRWHVIAYRTFDDLELLLPSCLAAVQPEVVIHCSAVSDYRTAGIYAPAAQTHFRPGDGTWIDDSRSPPRLEDRSAGKVKSGEPELWLRLVRTPKLVDRIRTDWGFRGVLVKFKLEVNVDDPQLLEIAERSRLRSTADLMVANTLEGMDSWAYLGPLDGRYERISRRELPATLLSTVERTAAGRGQR